MMRSKPFPFQRLLAAATATALLAGCAEQLGPQDPSEFYGQPQEAPVEEPIDFTDQNYDFTGPTPIADVVGVVPDNECVWYGFSPEDRFPRGDERIIDADCDFNTRYETKIDKIDEFPATVEGIVTLHPRYFQKVQVCEQDQRYYGSFFIQDSSGGMLVLKDSRIADFSFGDRVRLRVRGVMTTFDQPSVLIFDQQEVVEPGTKTPIYYKNVDECFGTAAPGSCGSLEIDLNCFDPEDIGEVVRIEGTVASEATSANFNEMRIEGDDGGTWSVSIDRELANRGVTYEKGERLRVTGPLINSYGLSLLVSRKGQVEVIE